MSENRGKQFEDIIQKAMGDVENTVVVRLHDQTTGYSGSKNPCDFVVFHNPIFYAIECKSVHGNTLPFSNITDYQWDSLLKMSNNKNVSAGIICWWVDKDVTLFLPITLLRRLKANGQKSIRFDNVSFDIIPINGTKKRVFFEYDMAQFFKDMEEVSWRLNLK